MTQPTPDHLRALQDTTQRAVTLLCRYEYMRGQLDRSGGDSRDWQCMESTERELFKLARALRQFEPEMRAPRKHKTMQAEQPPLWEE